MQLPLFRKFSFEFLVEFQAPGPQEFPDFLGNDTANAGNFLEISAFGDILLQLYGQLLQMSYQHLHDHLYLLECVQ